MLCHAGWIALRAPVYILGFPDPDSEGSIFREFELSPPRISGKKACWRGIFAKKFCIESDAHAAERSFPEASSLEKSEKNLKLGKPDGKLAGREEARFRANAEVGLNRRDCSFSSDSKVEDALPLGAKFAGRLASAALPNEDRVRYSKDDFDFLQPSMLSSSPEDRPWFSGSGMANAGQSGGDVSGRLHELQSETGKKAPNDPDGEDWRSLSRALATGHKFSGISNHDLMKIAELRFSSDMQEGDTGAQVSLLQKALFCLGYLSKRSFTSGYFGIETKQALCEFQEAHGVHSTGLWGSLSKQALWHKISAEILHRVADEKAQKLDAGHQNTVGATMPAWHITQSWNPSKFADAISKDLPEADWKLLSGMVLLLGGVLFGFIKSSSSVIEIPKNQSVKRRIVPSGGHEDSTLPLHEGSKGTKEHCPTRADDVTKSLRLTRTKPPSVTKQESSGQLGTMNRLDKKVIGATSSDIELEQDAQHTSSNALAAYRLRKKLTSAPTVSLQKGTTSKSADESMKDDRQPSSQGRHAATLGSDSAMNQVVKPELLPSRRRDYHKFQTESSLPLENSPMQGGVSVDTQEPSRKKLGGKTLKKQEMNSSVWNKKIIQGTSTEIDQQAEDELTIKKRIEELRKAVEAAELNGQAAMYALAEERERSLELEEKISRQREAAATLEEEVRFLKESHDALLASLRKKLSSSSATRGTSLLYQSFNSDDETSSESSF